MPADNFNLNVTQQVFILFYAITWGTAANSQPRWKAFAWGAVFQNAPAAWRAALSLILLNVFPLAYFAFILVCLGHGPWTALHHWDVRSGGRILLSTIPALSPFGFYRIWTAIVEFCSSRFYRIPGPWTGDRPRVLEDYGIKLDPCDIDPRFACPNLFWGMVYIGVGLIVSILGMSV
jgi:hypothetical protein